MLRCNNQNTFLIIVIYRLTLSSFTKTNALPPLVNYENTIFDEHIEFEKCDLRSVNLEKTLEYLKIQDLTI